MRLKQRVFMKLSAPRNDTRGVGRWAAPSAKLTKLTSIESTHEYLTCKLTCPGSLSLHNRTPPKVAPGLARSLYVVDIVFLAVLCKERVSKLTLLRSDAMRHVFAK